MIHKGWMPEMTQSQPKVKAEELKFLRYQSATDAE